MQISLDWIADFVDLSGISVDEMVSRMTLSTAEVEGFVTVKRFLENVVVGKIIAAEPFTSSEGRTQHFCTVDIGSSKCVTTVCGAPNVRVGMVAPFAKVGAQLAENVTIHECEINGKKSQGVLCSAAELGLSHWHEVVMEFPAETELVAQKIPLGTPLAKIIAATDTLIEFDNKSLTHRPDLWGHYGFAREFAAVFGRALKPLPRHDIKAYKNLPAYPLEIADLENCPCYGCIQFAAQVTSPSPIWLQARLHTLGQRTYNLGVDVTNYVALELGQPTHAFDAQRLGGIRVASLGREEKFRTLDDQERELLAEDLMIFGSVNGVMKPVAIAGIKGGAETEVTEKTESILLEAANFRAARIRRTSTRLDLRTDASQRFEKSQPPINVLVATERILQILYEAISVKVTSRFTVAGDLGESPRTIKLAAGELTRKAGIEIPRNRVEAILSSLGFMSKFATDGAIEIAVPPFRSIKDISLDVDIVEEILRIYGYDNMTPVMPAMPLAPLFIENKIKWEHKSRRLFCGVHRFLEVHNYCWFNDQWLQTLGFTPAATLTVKNPSTPWESRLRTTLIPTLLSLVDKNRPHRDAFRLLEYGHVFFPQKKSCDEKQHIAGVSFQAHGSLQEHFLQIKAAWEEMGKMLGMRFSFDEANESLSPWQQAAHWCTIKIEEDEKNLATQETKTVGGIGILEAKTLKKVCPDGGNVVWFEVDAAIFDRPLFPKVAFAEPPRFPGSWQDFSILASANDGYAALENLLNQFTHPLLRAREFITVYQDKKLGSGLGSGITDGLASYSFRFTLASPDHTLTGEEIESFHKTFLQFLQEKNLSLRS